MEKLAVIENLKNSVMFSRRKRSIPQLNTTSTADISFMLLIFFLVTTSIDADKGIGRKLPPPEKPQQELSTINKNNLLNIVIAADNSILVNERPLSEEKIVDEVATFIEARGTQHLISVSVSEEATYEQYFKLQNELTLAYNKVRNKIAQKQYGSSYKKLSSEQQEEIDKLYPHRVAESNEKSTKENQQ